uniref:Uncharacterized protein n=1 Tax=Arundo donax TaxID=35708 RepID=A0A0A8ZK64_ARUDO
MLFCLLVSLHVSIEELYCCTIKRNSALGDKAWI